MYVSNAKAIILDLWIYNSKNLIDSLQDYYLSDEGHLRHLFGSIDIRRHWFDGNYHLDHNPVFNETKVRTRWLHKKVCVKSS